MNKKVLYLVHGAVIAALYVVPVSYTHLQIRRNWKITLPSEMNFSITDMELCSLLGNILENVWQGCQSVSPPVSYTHLHILPNALSEFHRYSLQCSVETPYIFSLHLYYITYARPR